MYDLLVDGDAQAGWKTVVPLKGRNGSMVAYKLARLGVEFASGDPGTQQLTNQCQRPTDQLATVTDFLDLFLGLEVNHCSGRTYPFTTGPTP